MIKIKKILIAIILLNFLTSAFSETPLKENPDLVKGTLSNGMQYYILPNQEPKNMITLGLMIKEGSCMEKENERGVAHFVEHMCFNKTTHYAAQEYEKYIESIGLQNGRDVNGHTSFINTYFNTTVPLDNPESLNKAMLWLYDIASGSLAFDEKEIQKERSIILEEWRRSQGVSSNYNKQVNDVFYFKNSLFENKDPIGTEDSIKNLTKNDIAGYYKKWFRSDNMYFIAVGDINPDYLEEMVINTFKDIEKPENPIEEVDLSVPQQDFKTIMFEDKDFDGLMLYIQEKINDYNIKTTEERFKQDVIFGFIKQAFNSRISDLAINNDAKFLKGQLSTFYNYIQTNNYISVKIQPKYYTRESIIESLKTVKNELNRIKTFGITEYEFNKIKKANISLKQNTLKSLDRIDNNTLFSDLLSAAYYGNIFASKEDETNCILNIFENITIEEVNAVCKNIFPRDGDIVLLEVNESRKNLISQEEFEYFGKIYSTEVEEYIPQELPDTLMKRPSKKTALKSKKENELFGCTEYTLKNGVKIYTKKTDFEKGKIYFSAKCEGGTSVYEDEDYPSVCASANYLLYSGLDGYNPVELEKILKGKEYKINYIINSNNHGFTGYTVNPELEETLKHIYKVYNNPYFTEEGWQKTFHYYKGTLNGRSTTGNKVFNETINNTLYDDDIRFNGITKEFVDLLDKNKSEKIYREMFSNPADYSFFFVGDFDEEELIKLCCFYLNKPSGKKNKNTKSKIRNTHYTNQINYKTVKYGNNTSSNVFIGFKKPIEVSEDPSAELTQTLYYGFIQDYLATNLNYKIREEKGGTYSIKPYIYYGYNPEKYCFSYIIFECNSGREEELINATVDLICELQNSEIPDEYIERYKSNANISLDQNIKNNNWWLNRLINSYFAKCESPEIIMNRDLYLQIFDKEKIQENFKNFFDKENYVVIILEPEK